MDVRYKSAELDEFCHNRKKAAKKMERFADDRLAKINFIEQAASFNDIMTYPPFHCHQLGKDKKDLNGCWGLDVKGRKASWRIIVAPLDENDNIIIPGPEFRSECKYITIIRIEEVSNHYE